MEANGYAPKTDKPVESWSSSPAAAARFAETTGRGWSVIVEAPRPDPKKFKDISPLVREFAGEIAKQSNPPVTTESEWLLASGPMKVRRIRRDNETRTVRIELQERGTR